MLVSLFRQLVVSLIVVVWLFDSLVVSLSRCFVDTSLRWLFDTLVISQFREFIVCWLRCFAAKKIVVSLFGAFAVSLFRCLVIWLFDSLMVSLCRGFVNSWFAGCDIPLLFYWLEVSLFCCSVVLLFGEFAVSLYHCLVVWLFEN